MSQRESKLSRRIMKSLRLEGWFCFKVHGSEYMMAGLPDIICCAEGLFIGLETKYPGERDNVSPRQAYVHSLIADAQGVVEVITSPEEAVQTVRKALQNRK